MFSIMAVLRRAIVAIVFCFGMFGAVITPSDPQGWLPANVVGGGSVAITGTEPQSGNGSLEFNGTSGSSKADYTLAVTPFRLADLSNFSIDLYRDGSSTVAGHLAPAVRLLVSNGQTTNSTSYLISEPVYNGGGTIATNTWTTFNLLDDNYWQRAFKTTPPNQTIEIYNRTLTDWLATGTVTDGGGHTSNIVGPDAMVLAIEIGIGSGWSGTTKMFADNLTVGVNGQDTTYNFEVSNGVPEPMTFVLMGAGLAGIAALRRRRRSS